MSYKNYNISKADEYQTMDKNYTKTEKWYLLSNADQILSFK